MVVVYFFCVSAECGLWIDIGHILFLHYGSDCVRFGYLYGAVLETFDSPVEEKLGLAKTANFASTLESSLQTGNNCFRGSGKKEIIDGNGVEDWAFYRVT